jgi:hypothetical protein
MKVKATTKRLNTVDIFRPLILHTVNKIQHLLKHVTVFYADRFINHTCDRGDGWIADTFNTTVKMSSYLNCLAIGEFEYLESTGQFGMPVSSSGNPVCRYVPRVAQYASKCIK